MKCISTFSFATLLVAGCAPTEPEQTADIQSAVTPRAYQGIYVLGNERLGSLELTSNDYVDGYALRTAWTTLDLAPGQYDFSLIANALAGLAPNKKLSLTIEAALVPDYVLANAKTTYYVTLPNQEEPLLTPVTWDPNTLASYRTFMSNLANARFCRTGLTCSASDLVALKNHPALSGLRINIIGMGKLRQDSSHGGGTIFNVPTYDRQTFIDAVLSNIHYAQDQFPNITSWIPYFSVDDSGSGTNQNPSLDVALLDAITTEFDGSPGHPAIGMFQELLKGDSPSTAGTNGSNLLYANARGSFSVFQACGGWVNHSLCTFTQGDDSPQNGMALGYGSYGTRYYELYTGDLVNAPFESMLTTWSTFTKDPTDANNPVALTATPGTGRQNVLRWTDTSQLETNVIVERKTLPSGNWDTYDTLDANTTSYVDANANRGVSYSYRVHEVETSGSLIASNEAIVAGH